MCRPAIGPNVLIRDQEDHAVCDSGGGSTQAAGGGAATAEAAGSTAAPASSHAPAAHGAVKTCTLITAAEASKALGESATAGRHDPDSDSPTDCTWSATDIDHFSTFVDIDVDSYFDSEYDHRNDAASKAVKVITVVPGLGDKAFTEYTKGSPASKVGLASNLQIKKGDVALSIQVLNPSMTRAQSFAADKALAAAALGRL